MRDRRLSAAADFLMRCADHIAPAEQQEWLRAMRAELDHLNGPTERVQWAAGCFVAALKMLTFSPAARFYCCSVALLALITFYDWRSADPTLTIAALVIIPGTLAYARPEQRWGIGALFGLWLLIAHVVADSSGLRPHYQKLPLSTSELIEIALLLAVTTPAAALGGWSRRLDQRSAL